MTVREFCEGLMQRNNMSVSAFSASLGYKSVNSIYRIMDGNVRNSSLVDFQSKMASVYHLTPGECDLLRDAIYAKLYGNEKKVYYTAIEQFLSSRQSHQEDNNPADSNPFQEIYTRYSNKHDLRVTVLNCLDRQALVPIHHLLENGAKVAHYLHHRITPLDLLRSLDILSIVMFYPKYTCFAEQTDAIDSRLLQGKDRSDLLWCSYKENDNVSHVDMVQLTNQGPVFYPDIRVPVPSFTNSYKPVKMQWLNAEQLRDYPTFGRKCEELDRNRATFKIKSDLTYAEISGDRWAPLLRDGPMATEPQFEQALAVLTEIYNNRFTNNMTKKKHTWHIMKLIAMERFMETGRISDHMWAMRAFTPSERISVLKDLISCCSNNQFRHLLFLKDDYLTDHLEFDLYDDYCLLFQNSNTCYDLSNTHGEYVLTHPVLLKWFKQYYVKIIVKNMCYSEAQSLVMLQHLLETARASNKHQ